MNLGKFPLLNKIWRFHKSCKTRKKFHYEKVMKKNAKNYNLVKILRV